ncbi:MAG: FMN-binding protein [Proteobacteria bacterium]|nr:FMN-binding protein [Pseudomonadota bacterium]
MRGDDFVGYAFVDEVVGWRDFITYAVGIDAGGKLGVLEILAYWESRGTAVRTNGWRRQFAGREGLGQLRLRTDIKNIAGTTVSCEHVTQGVRWLVALWEVVLRPSTEPGPGQH